MRLPFKMTSLCAVSLLSAACLIAYPSVAMAQEAPVGQETYANTGDTGFHFYMKSSGNTSGTGFRRKDNATAVYVHVAGHKNAPRMFVDGARNNSGSGWRDCTQGIYRARSNGKWAIHTLVYENGFRSARITSRAERADSLVTGLWSPDSSRGYPTMGA